MFAFDMETRCLEPFRSIFFILFAQRKAHELYKENNKVFVVIKDQRGWVWVWKRKSILFYNIWNYRNSHRSCGGVRVSSSRKGSNIYNTPEFGTIECVHSAPHKETKTRVNEHNSPFDCEHLKCTKGPRFSNSQFDFFVGCCD